MRFGGRFQGRFSGRFGGRFDGGSGRSRVPIPPSLVAPGLFIDTAMQSAIQDGSDVSLASILSIVRATTAMDEQPDGSLISVGTNVARYGGGQGLLIERGATNNFLQSAGFSTGSWGKIGITVSADSWTARDATLTGDTLVEDTSTGNHYITQTVAAPQANAAMAVSIDVAPGTGRYFKLQASNIGFIDAVSSQFDLILGTVIANTNSGTGAGATGQIQQLSNGVFRCILLGTPSTGASNTTVVFQCMDALNVSSYTGTSRTWNVWGAQIEPGPKATAYIPTSTVAVTRNADQIKITGTPLTAGIGAGTAFTIFAEYEAQVSASASFIWGITNDSTPGDGEAVYTFVQTNRTGNGAVVTASSDTFTDSGVALYTPPTLSRTAMRVAANDAAISHNGSAVTTDITVSLPAVSLTRIALGGSAGSLGAQCLNGRLTRFAAWPSLLSNADLVALTLAG